MMTSISIPARKPTSKGNAWFDERGGDARARTDNDHRSDYYGISDYRISRGES